MLWTDTAGVFSLIEAVGCGPDGLFLLRAKVPDWVFSQFLPRSDDPIGVQEALAVWRLVTSFKKLLGGARHTPTPTMTGLRRHTSRITLIRRRKTPWWLWLVFRLRRALTFHVRQDGLLGGWTDTVHTHRFGATGLP